MNFSKPTLCVLLTLFCFCDIANSATASKNITGTSESETSRPKIGLVLSGGGARGFAHIGVLKVLEENNVPIDYIVGTSMGSVIGGLYAIGLNPNEIESGIASVSWEKIFEDFAYRKYKRFRRKQDDFEFFNIARIGITDDGLQLSPGLINGQQIDLAVGRLTYPGLHIKDFDKLRIPYRAVATNIENGSAFIAKGGSIAGAMRASMSIPGALPPIIIDDTLLVDGGIANNIPINIARDMGADIVIVVDVSAPLTAKEDIKSSLDITAQLTTIMTRRIADKQLKTLKTNDVLIVPGEEKISSSDFDQYAALVLEGVKSAKEEIKGIQNLSLSYNDYSKYVASLPTVLKREPIISSIKLNNLTTLNDEVFRVRISQKIGDPLDIYELDKNISYINGLDFSDSVFISLEEKDEKTLLILDINDRKWAPSYLEFGMSIESTLGIDTLFNVSASYVKQDINGLAGELRAIADIGSEPEINIEYYQPLNTYLNTFFAAKTGVESKRFPNIINDDADSVQRLTSIFLDLSVGQLLNETTEFRIGAKIADGRSSTISGNPLAGNSNYKEGYTYARILHDSLDNLSFPNSGVFAKAAYETNTQGLGSDSNYQQLQLVASGAGTYRRYTFFSRAILETTFEDNAPFNAAFRHGGFLEISGTQDNELAGQHFGLLETVFYRRLGNSSFLPAYAGFSLEAGNAWNTSADVNATNTILASSLFIGADTFMGPLYLAYGFNDKGKQILYFNLGKTFIGDN